MCVSKLFADDEAFLLQTSAWQRLHPEQTNQYRCCVLVCSCCVNVEPSVSNPMNLKNKSTGLGARGFEKRDVGVQRSQTDDCEELPEELGDGTAIGRKL